ncbi:MAG TPA: type II toxin-antitoxin system VapC family toxin [Blastocatellia bacterium]|nr:type II toxin-antitoxin system VapC family toxin [Blastocatellia bacterium]
MSLYILDTDHLSLYQRNRNLFQEQLKTTPSPEIVTTIITAEEQLRGRFLQISQAKVMLARTNAYWHLRLPIESLNEYHLLDYDAQADAVFTTLRQAKLRIGTNDLRIAAITLAVGGTLLTRNIIDFGQIPTLKIEDWTK